eukprot:scaffold109781_cov92-Cyclotella_meneghiniana.AAC.3
MIKVLNAPEPNIACLVVASIFPFTWYWHKETHDLMQALYQSGDGTEVSITLSALKQQIKGLPRVVQLWMETTLCLQDKTDDTPVTFARALRIEQEGTFLLNERWMPFKATQEFSTNHTHPGFVWDAEIQTQFAASCNLTVPVSVRDSYVHGKGGMMKAQLPLGIPLASMKDTDDVNLGKIITWGSLGTCSCDMQVMYSLIKPQCSRGEIMRWLAEATLFPTALLPQDCTSNDSAYLKWSPGTDNSAVLEFKYNNQTAKINFHFDPDTHMVKFIQAKRPRIVDGQTQMAHWEGHCSENELHGGMLVPTRMEAGWKVSENGPLELYFKGKNAKLIYMMNNHGYKDKMENEHTHVD